MKSRGYVLISILICFFSFVKGQSRPFLSNSYVGTSVGFAYPMGGLSATSSSDWSGRALRGFDINISAGIDLYHAIGVSTMISYFKNRYDVKNYIKTLSTAYPGIYSKVSTKDYTQKCFMVGIFGTYHLTDRLWCDARIMGGLMITDYPNPSWTVTDSTYITSWSVNVNESTAFAVDIGLGVRYLISSRYFLMGNLDFLFSNPLYSGNEVVYVPPAQYQIISGRLDVTYLTPTIGIGYKIFK